MASINVDSAASLNAALASAHSGDTILLAPGTYSGLNLQNLNFAAAGVTLSSQDASHPAVFTNFSMTGCSGLTFSHLEMSTVGSSDPYYGFRVSSCQNVTFDSIYMHGQVGADPNGAITGFLIRSSSDINVTNSHFEYLQTAISHLGDNGLNFSGNTFDNLAADGIDGGGSSNVQILNNYFTDTWANTAGFHPDAIQFWTAGTTSSAHDITISGNTFVRGDGIASQGIFLWDEVGNLPYQNVTITNNVISGAQFNGITLDDAINPLITGNTVTAYADQASWIRLENVIGGLLAKNSAGDYIIDGSDSGISQSGNTTTPAAPVPTTPPSGDSVGQPTAPTAPTAPTTGLPGGPTGLVLDGSTASGGPGSNVTNVAQVRIDGFGEPGASIVLYDGTTVIGTGMADPTTGAFSILTTGPLASGVHSLTATAADRGGVSALSGPISVTVDTQPAAASLLHESVHAGSGAASVTLGGMSAPGLAGVAYAITVLQDGVPVGVIASANGAWSFTQSNVTDAVHVYTLKTLDTAANVGAGADTLIVGSSGRDTIHGLVGDNVIAGGSGADTLTGGSGHNTFIYNAASDAPVSAGHGHQQVETITNWVTGQDHIDLSAMGQLAFGGQSQSVSAHSVEWYVSGGNTYIVGDAQGHAKPGFMIELAGVHQLSASDFVFG